MACVSVSAGRGADRQGCGLISTYRQIDDTHIYTHALAVRPLERRPSLKHWALTCSLHAGPQTDCHGAQRETHSPGFLRLCLLLLLLLPLLPPLTDGSHQSVQTAPLCSIVSALFFFDVCNAAARRVHSRLSPASAWG